MPVMASSSSLWPLPSMAAMPSTSPARASRLTPRTETRPRLSRTERFSTDIMVSPGTPVFSSLSKSTGRPTIMEAISFSVMSFVSDRPTSFP